jgi:hypothetical protein
VLVRLHAAKGGTYRNRSERCLLFAAVRYSPVPLLLLVAACVNHHMVPMWMGSQQMLAAQGCFLLQS